MPVEIRELVISVSVEANPDVARAGPAVHAASVDASTEDEREALVEACVTEVMKILRRSRER